MDSERQAKVTVQVTYSSPQPLALAFFWLHENLGAFGYQLPPPANTSPKQTQ